VNTLIEGVGMMEKLKRILTTRNGVITLISGIGILGVLIVLFFNFQITQINERILLEVRSDLRTYSNEVDSKIANVATDLLLLEELFLMQSQIDISNGEIVFISEDNKESVQNGLKAWLSNKHVYDQIRVIDLSGNEIIRVNYNENNPTIVSDDKLQNKSGRYYFEDALVLADDTIYLSELDLNIENGEIEYIDGKPKEMLRVASPLFKNGKKIGIILVNYLSENLFTPQENFSTYSFEVINDDGYYIYSLDESKEYGFMYEDGEEEVFSKYHEYILQELKSSEISQEIIENDSYTSLMISEAVLSSTISSFVKKDVEVVSENSKIIIFEEIDLKLTNEYKSLLGLSIILLATGTVIVVVISVLVSEIAYQRKTKLISLEYSANHDILTGIFNRAKIYEVIKYYTEREKKFTVLFMDLDGFKLVNDNLGHEAGDEILLETAKRLKKSVRMTDVVARLGGDEFMVLLDNVYSENDIRKVISNIKISIGKEFFYKKNSVNIGISVGFSIQDTTKTVDELIYESDVMMYDDKKNNKFPD
jgi:diguanylate cyclase (GGDEF)-like protein